MSLNLKKLAVAAAVVVSMVGLFAESAKAELDLTFEAFDSDLKLGDQQVKTSFNIDTEKSFEEAVENFSLTNSITGTTFFTSAAGSIGQRTLLNTASDVDGFLNNLGLDSFQITRNDVFDRIPGEEPIAAYVMNLTNDLTPNDEATLTLFFDQSKASFPQENGLANLITSPEGVVSYVGTQTVPGVLIRNYRNGLDNPGNVINGRVIDKYGVDIDDAPNSAPFSVRVPESTTSNGLLVVGAFGGLLMLKRNQRVNKFQASIKNKKA